MAERPADLAERLRVLLDWAVHDVDALAGAVVLTDGELEQLVGASVISAPTPAGHAPPTRADELVRQVAGRHAPVLLPASLTDASPASTAGESTASLGAPLRSTDRLLGVLQVDFGDRAQLTDATVKHIGLVADHITAVAESALLYQESRARNAELERVNADLRELDRIQGDFLSMVSHELRTPLTAIIGYTDLLLRQVHGPLNERQSGHGAAVRKAAHRLLGLINDLLDVTRLESRQIQLTVAPLPLEEVVSRAIAEVEAAAEQRDVELRLDVPTSLPTVLADRDRLHQVLGNLLDNAVKFTAAGGSVTLRADRREGQAHVCVADTGVGVAPEHLEIIWNRFHQVDSSTRRRFGGTGLGLAIVRNLVALHQGTVEAASGGIGAGSTFCFTIPLAPVARTTSEAAPRRPASIPDGWQHERRILVVDDEIDNLTLIALIVTDVLGHQAWLARDGQEALRRAREGPDVILLDLRMPGLSGFELAGELKADPRTADVPLVALTALADPDDREAALAAGCASCLTKPFTPAELADAVQDALGQRRTIGVAP